MKKTPRILVVEDETDVRELLLLHLAREGWDAIGADNGEDALKHLEKGAFDLAVVDWMLPGLSGLDLCRKMAGKLPILMVTARAEPSDIVLGLELGADDYVTKPFELPVLIARSRALLRRAGRASAVEASGTIRIEDLVLDSDQHEVTCGGSPLSLTASEFKLLHSLMKNQGKVLSRDRLIELVHGEGVTVVDRAIDTHVFGLRKKLGPCADVVETIRGVGYRVKAST